MKFRAMLVSGTLASLAGALWILQGLGHVGGSAMTGERLWTIVGAVVALVGVVLVGFAIGGLLRSPPSR